jgi:hypothetical protein
MSWPVKSPRVTEVQPLGNYRVRLTFNDGTAGELDLTEWIVGQSGVFQPLQDPDFFARVRVNSEAGTIQWPNEVDLCPDVLYSRVTGEPIPFASESGAALSR